MDPVNHSSSSLQFYDDFDAIDGFSLGEFQSSSSTSSSSFSSSLDLMSLAQPIWDIHCARDEISVDGFVFRPGSDARECRIGFLRLMSQLKIPRVFHFQLNGKIYEPDDSYDDNPNRPMLFDLLPLLECRRNLIREGENVRGFEVLLNWIIQLYLPVEEISFMVYEPPHREIEREVIGLPRLMEIYGFEPRFACSYEAYNIFPPKSTVYVPVEPRHNPSPMEQFQEDILNIERCLNEIIEDWLENQNPERLQELDSYVMIVETNLLPRCPPHLESALRHQVIFAKEILFQSQNYSSSVEPEPKLSPESDRRRRRDEKEKMEV